MFLLLIVTKGIAYFEFLESVILENVCSSGNMESGKKVDEEIPVVSSSKSLETLLNTGAQSTFGSNTLAILAKLSVEQLPSPDSDLSILKLPSGLLTATKQDHREFQPSSSPISKNSAQSTPQSMMFELTPLPTAESDYVNLPVGSPKVDFYISPKEVTLPHTYPDVSKEPFVYVPDPDPSNDLCALTTKVSSLPSSKIPTKDPAVGLPSPRSSTSSKGSSAAPGLKRKPTLPSDLSSHDALFHLACEPETQKLSIPVEAVDDVSADEEMLCIKSNRQIIGYTEESSSSTESSSLSDERSSDQVVSIICADSSFSSDQSQSNINKQKTLKSKKQRDRHEPITEESSSIQPHTSNKSPGSYKSSTSYKSAASSSKLHKVDSLEKSNEEFYSMNKTLHDGFTFPDSPPLLIEEIEKSQIDVFEVIHKFQMKIKQRDEHVKKLEEYMKTYVENFEHKVRLRDEKLQSRNEKIELLKEKLQFRAEKIRSLEEQVQSKDEKIQSEKLKTQVFEEKLQSRDNIIQTQQGIIRSLEHELKNWEEIVKEYKEAAVQNQIKLDEYENKEKRKSKLCSCISKSKDAG